MGGKDSKKTKTIVETKLNMEINNTTTNINKVLQETINETVTNVVTENASKVKVSTAASNKMQFDSINASGDSDVDLSQDAKVQATSKAIITLVQSSQQMASLASQMGTDLQNKLQNDSSMKAALQAATALKNEVSNAGGPEAMVGKIMDTLGGMGKKTDEQKETEIRNSFNLKISNTTVNQNEITNKVKNHVENNMKKVNSQSCDLQTSGDNIMSFGSINASGRGKVKLTQSLLINAFSDCIINAMDTTALTQDITGLTGTKTSSDTTNKSSAGGEMKTDTKVEDKKEEKSAIMDSVNNLVNKIGDVAQSGIASGAIVFVVLGLGVLGFLLMGGGDQIASVANAVKKGGGLDQKSKNVVTILGLILLFNIFFGSKNKK